MLQIMKHGGWCLARCGREKNRGHAQPARAGQLFARRRPAGGGGALRRPGAFGESADRGDRHSHGPRSVVVVDPRSGDPRGTGAGNKSVN